MVLDKVPVEFILIILFPVVILFAPIVNVPETPKVPAEEASVNPLLSSTVKVVNAPVGTVVEFLNVPDPLIVCAKVITYPIPPKVNGCVVVSVPLLIIFPPIAS